LDGAAASSASAQGARSRQRTAEKDLQMFSHIHDRLKRMEGQMNKVAATWSAAAALFAFLSWGLGLLAHS
jgi:hypothetical protein